MQDGVHVLGLVAFTFRERGGEEGNFHGMNQEKSALLPVCIINYTVFISLFVFFSFLSSVCPYHVPYEYGITKVVYRTLGTYRSVARGTWYFKIYFFASFKPRTDITN